MYINDVQLALKACLVADVVPALTGHRGIGKTEIVKQLGKDWVDLFTGKKGIPVIPLYCATQEVTDLIGFPIKVWAKSGNPVVEGIKEEGEIITSWATPSWWPEADPEEEAKDREIIEKIKKEVDEGKRPESDIWLFWNRPKFIIFLDEAKRAQRDVMQAMYPLVLTKQLHMHKLPRGSRIITADNFAGAYDVREPDEAFMSRFCHLEVEPEIKSWHQYATNNGVSSKVRNFLTSNPSYLIQVPQDFEESCTRYKPIPDPRSWDMVDRIGKYGGVALRDLPATMSDHIIRRCIVGCVGEAAAAEYMSFSDTTISFEDILKGKAEVKKALQKMSDDVERNKLKEKLQIEAGSTLQDRKYSKAESQALCKFLKELDSKDRTAAILQTVFTIKNNNKLDQKWIDDLMADPKVMIEIDHLMKKKKVS